MIARTRTVWSLAMWSLEARIVCAALLLLWALYRIHALDEVARLFLVRNLQGKFKLPVEIDAARLDVWRGSLTLLGVRMLAPPKDRDARWHYDRLVSADSVTLECDPLVFLHFFLASHGRVLSLIGVYVQGVQFYLEGYVSSEEGHSNEGKGKEGQGQGKASAANTKISSRKQPVRAAPAVTMVYNFKLVGGEVKKRLRRRKPTQRDQALQRRGTRLQQLRQRRAQQAGLGAGAAGERGGAQAVVSTSVPVPRLAPGPAGAAPAAAETSSPSAQPGAAQMQPASAFPTPVGGAGADRKPIRSSIFGMVSKANSYMKEAETKGGLLKMTSSSLSRIVTDYNTEVQSSGGLMAHAKSKASSVMTATKARLDGAYQHAKERLRVSYGYKIIEFHEKLRGGEPIPDSRDGYMHLAELRVADIEVHLRGVLPVRLRSLEKTSFLVPEIVIEPAEFSAIRAVLDPSDRAGQRRRDRAAAGGAMGAGPRAGGSVTASGKYDEHEAARPAAAGRQEEHALSCCSDVIIDDIAKPTAGSDTEDGGRGVKGVAAEGSAGDKTAVSPPRDQDPLEAPDGPAGAGGELSLLSALLAAAAGLVRSGADVLLEVAHAAAHFQHERFRHRLTALLETSHRESAGLPGVPICVLVYRLERVLLSEMLQDNAGRVINDAVSDWVGWKGAAGAETAAAAAKAGHGPGEPATSGSGSGDNTKRSDVHQAGDSALRQAFAPADGPAAGAYEEDDDLYEEDEYEEEYGDQYIETDSFEEGGEGDEAEAESHDQQLLAQSIMEDMLHP
jgi:hypothetical protein